MSHSPDIPETDRARIDREAADWIARRYAGLTDWQTAELEQWLARDPRHAAAWAELDETWQLLDRVGTTPLARAMADDPDPDVLAPRRDKTSIGRRWLVPLAFAAAAALALVYVGGRRAVQPGLDFTEQVATAVGIWQSLDLPDGSRVRLNTDSHIEVAYSAAERRVWLLRGEAHFSVAKNPARPFFVEVGGVAVRAVGTAFNVRLQAEAVEVLVTEGRVCINDVQDGASVIAQPVSLEPPLLVAGQKAVIPSAPLPAEKRPLATVAAMDQVAIERALAWQNQRLEFVAAPLRDIVAEFNRYNRHKLSVAEESLALRRFGGSFRADDPETFVRLLQTRFNVSSERRGDGTILLENRR